MKTKIPELNGAGARDGEDQKNYNSPSESEYNTQFYEIAHNDKIYTALYADQDRGNVVIGPSDDNFSSIFSCGFASCIATVLRDPAGDYISLSHSSMSIYPDTKATDIELYCDLVAEEKDSIVAKSDQSLRSEDIRLDVGFSFHEFCVGIANEFFPKNMQIDVFNGDYTKINEIEDHYRQQFKDRFNDSKKTDAEEIFTNKFEMLRDIENVYKIKIINLPKSTILVSKGNIDGGEIITDIDEEYLKNLIPHSIRELDEDLEVSSSSSESTKEEVQGESFLQNKRQKTDPTNIASSSTASALDQNQHGQKK